MHKKGNFYFIKPVRYLFLMLLLTTFTTVFAQQAKTYDEAIKQADEFYRQSKFFDAKAYYQMALTYTPNDGYATKQLELTVEKLKEQQRIQEEYYNHIDLADKYFEDNDWSRSLTEYQRALHVIPGDEYAQDQIDKVKRKKSEEKDKLISFNMAIQEGNAFLAEDKFDEAIADYQEAHRLLPNRPEPLEKIEMAKKLQNETANKLTVFNEEMEQAINYMKVKDYISALQHVENANLIYPKNTRAKKKIKEIQPLAEKQQTYDSVVEEADNMYMEKDFTAAKKKYEQAQKTFPENAYAPDMISRIDDVMAEQRKNLDKNYNKSVRKADSLLALNEYKAAKAEFNLALTLKPEESYPNSKLKEIDTEIAKQRQALDAQYANIITEADSLYNNFKFQQAKQKYNEALAERPDDEYPKQKLTDIDTQLALMEKDRKTDSTYQALVTEADKLYAAGTYEQAMNKYAEAQNVKSYEEYPKTQIDAIRLMIADAEKQKEIDAQYGKLITRASALLEGNNLNESKTIYQQALELKPGDLLAVRQIGRIDSTLTARKHRAELEKQCNAYIADGDSLLNLQMFEAAINNYQKAVVLLPDYGKANDKLNAAINAKKKYEEAIARQQAYDTAIARGNRLFGEENYELAKTEFQKAVELNSSEKYPQDKIIEINGILKRLEAEREERYNLAITKADNLFEQENYSEAVIQYKVANSIKPEEAYPSQQIMDCNSMIEEQLRKLKAKYDIAIADADKLYAAKIYDKAISGYQNAKAIKPDESYPVDMIRKITKLIEENMIVDVVDTIVNIAANTTEKFDFEPVPINVRKSNYVLVKAKNLSDKEFKIIFSYGSGNGKNGGFVVPVPQSGDYNDYIIRVGNQYKWFSEDNNWITVYPENGDIEVKMIRISTSD